MSGTLGQDYPFKTFYVTPSLSLLHNTPFPGVRQLLEDNQRYKDKEQTFNEKVKRIDSFFSDLRKGLAEIMERVHTVGNM